MRKSLELLPSLFDEIKLVRDDYRNGYEKELDRKKSILKELPEKYLGAELVRRREAAQKDFDTKVQKLKTDFSDRIIRAVSEVESQTENEIRRPFTPSPITSLITQGLSVSQTEYDVLYKAFAGDSYWNSKLFADLAVKNGLDVEIPATADEVFNVLRTIKSEADAFLNLWSGQQESDIQARMMLSDRKISKWENTCLHGYTASMTSQQRVSRMLESVIEAGTSPMARILAIGNVARNLENSSDSETLELFLCGVAQDDRLYNLSVLPFLDPDFQQIIKDFRDGKRHIPEPKKETDEEKEYELSPAEQETANALSELAHKKQELQDRRRAEIVANMSKESAPATATTE